MNAHDDAVKAVAAAIRDHWGGSDFFVNDLATRAVTAAAPILLAEAQRNFDFTLNQRAFAHAYIEMHAPEVLADHGKQIAEKCRAGKWPRDIDSHTAGWNEALETAARIAEGSVQ